MIRLLKLIKKGMVGAGPSLEEVESYVSLRETVHYLIDPVPFGQVQVWPWWKVVQFFSVAPH